MNPSPVGAVPEAALLREKGVTHEMRNEMTPSRWNILNS